MCSIEQYELVDVKRKISCLSKPYAVPAVPECEYLTFLILSVRLHLDVASVGMSEEQSLQHGRCKYQSYRLDAFTRLVIPLLRYIGAWERQETLWVPLAFTTIHNGVI